MSSHMAQLQEATVKAHCKALRMPMIASQFGTLAEQAIREKKSHIGYLEALLLADRVVVLQEGQLVTDLRVPLPRPRHRGDRVGLRRGGARG